VLCIDESRVSVVRDAPYPCVKRFDLVLFHARKYVLNDLACKVFGIVSVAQPFLTEAQDRFDIFQDLVLIHGFPSFRWDVNAFTPL